MTSLMSILKHVLQQQHYENRLQSVYTTNHTNNNIVIDKFEVKAIDCVIDQLIFKAVHTVLLLHALKMHL